MLERLRRAGWNRPGLGERHYGQAIGSAAGVLAAIRSGWRLRAASPTGCRYPDGQLESPWFDYRLPHRRAIAKQCAVSTAQRPCEPSSSVSH